MKSLEERQADRAKRKAEAEAAAGVTSEGEGEENDYNSWKVADLKAELDSRGVAYEAGAKKADLVAALEAADAE